MTKVKWMNISWLYWPHKLPTNEGIVKRINVSRDEGSPPVHMKPHRHQVNLAQRREVFEPVVAVSELRNLWNDQQHNRYFLFSYTNYWEKTYLAVKRET